MSEVRLGSVGEVGRTAPTQLIRGAAKVTFASINPATGEVLAELPALRDGTSNTGWRTTSAPMMAWWPPIPDSRLTASGAADTGVSWAAPGIRKFINNKTLWVGPPR